MRGLLYAPLLWLFLSASLLMSGCRKEEFLPPVIEVERPLEMSRFSVGDTIRVKASIRSERPLIRLSLSLLSPQGLRIQPPLEWVPQSNSVDLDVMLPLLDTTLSSGIFQLHFLAVDEEEEKHKYRSIQVEGLPRTLKSYALVNRVFSDQKRLIVLSPSLGTLWEDTLEGDHEGFAVMHHDQMAILSGSIFGSLVGYSLREKEVNWSVPAMPNPPFRYFTGLSASQQGFIVSFEAGFIRNYTAAGSVVATITTELSLIPEEVLLHGSSLIVDVRSRFGPERYLKIYNYPSGSMRHTISPGLADAILLDAGDKIFWMGNMNGSGEVKILDPGTGDNHLLFRFEGEAIRTATLRDDDNLFVATPSGIFWLRPGQSSKVLFSAALRPEFMAFDRINDFVLAGDSSSLFVITFPSAALVHTRAFDGRNLDFTPVYNY